VIGNHEYFYVKSDAAAIVARDNTPTDLRKEALLDLHINSKYVNLRTELIEHQDWILSLPTLIERDKFILVHGGIHPDYGLDTPPEIATLIRMARGRPWYESYAGTKPIIY
jgi:hypothetical protein